MNEVYWKVDGLDNLIHDLKIMGKGVPTFRMLKGLQIVLEHAFLDTQEKAHVISGSLKASGKSSEDWDGEKWTANIEYGGPLITTPIPAPGYSPSQTAPKDPVDYAIYEMARGGEHDWFRDLPLFEPFFEKVFDQFVDGIE